MKLTDATRAEIRESFAVHNGSGVPEDALARMLADHAIGLLEHQRSEWFAEPERTPEVVLRAMLAAYEAAALEAAMAWMRADVDNADEDYPDLLRATRDADDRCNNARDALASFLVGGNYLAILATWSLSADYEARLRGERPLNASPMEV